MLSLDLNLIINYLENQSKSDSIPLRASHSSREVRRKLRGIDYLQFLLKLVLQRFLSARFDLRHRGQSMSEQSHFEVPNGNLYSPNSLQI